MQSGKIKISNHIVCITQAQKNPYHACLQMYNITRHQITCWDSQNLVIPSDKCITGHRDLETGQCLLGAPFSPNLSGNHEEDDNKCRCTFFQASKHDIQYSNTQQQELHTKLYPISGLRQKDLTRFFVVNSWYQDTAVVAATVLSSNQRRKIRRSLTGKKNSHHMFPLVFLQ